MQLSPGLRTGAAVAAAMVILGAAATGCGLVKTVKQVTGALQANKTIIDQFTGNLQSGQPTQFEATYTTTGSTPSTVTYAVRPPSDLAIAASVAGSSPAAANARFIVNATGQFSCTHVPAGGWSCSKMPKGGASAQSLLDLYTPAHWVTFLQDFSVAVGFAGDKITKSSLTVNGFPMQCVDFTTAGVPGTSKVCTTAQHLLGLVQVAGQPIGFEITKYSATPDASLFQLPAGAKVTTPSGSGSS